MILSSHDIVHYDFDFMGIHGNGPDILRIRIEHRDGSYVSMAPVPIHRGQTGFLMVVKDSRLHQRIFHGKKLTDDVVIPRLWSHLEDNLICEDPILTGDVCQCAKGCYCIHSFYRARFR